MQPDYSQRYQRHLMLPQVGAQGQQRLLLSRVLVVGVGGLGSPVSLYLAAAGVGHLRLADADVVDLSNLQRQVLHSTPDVGVPKVASAKAKLEAINPGVEVEPLQVRFDAATAAQLLQGCDVAIDCTDNAASKFLIAQQCAQAGVPLVHGAVGPWGGNVMTIVPGSASLRDLFPTPPRDEQPQGVLGVVPGIIGSIQAAEALKLILGIGEPLTNQLLTFDALSMQFTTVRLR